MLTRSQASEDGDHSGGEPSFQLYSNGVITVAGNVDPMNSVRKYFLIGPDIDAVPRAAPHLRTLLGFLIHRLAKP